MGNIIPLGRPSLPPAPLRSRRSSVRPLRLLVLDVLGDQIVSCDCCWISEIEVSGATSDTLVDRSSVLRIEGFLLKQILAVHLHILSLS